MSERAEIARRHGLPAPLAERLQGSTDEELEADAKNLASQLGEKPEPEHVALARRALQAAEGNPNQGELAAFAVGKSHQKLIESLHPDLEHDE